MEGEILHYLTTQKHLQVISMVIARSADIVWLDGKSVYAAPDHWADILSS